MLLKSIKLENFRQFVNEQIDSFFVLFRGRTVIKNTKCLGL